MNAPSEDGVVVANKDGNVSEGQSNSKRKRNAGLHIGCRKCGASYPGHFKRDDIEKMKAYWENYSHSFKPCTSCSEEKNTDEEDSDYYRNFAKSTRILIAKMVVIGKLPLNFVKDEGLKKFLEQCVCAFNPEFVIPSKATIIRDILEMYKREKALLRTMIVDQNINVSLTVNTWTSNQGMNYMVLTGHFINLGWKLQRRILNFRQIENLKGETIGREVEKCLNQWGITNIFTLTVDNASSQDTAISYLVNRFKNGLVLDSNFVQVRCCADIFKLIICDVMEDFHELISKVRNAVRFVRSSPIRYRSFEKCIEEENISCKSVVCLDVPTRWDNTYMMLEGAEKFEKAFDRLRIHDSTFLNEDIPSSRDWEVIRTLVEFLSLFYKAILKLSGSLYGFSHMAFHEICNIQKYIKKRSSNSDNLVVNDMAMKIQAKYDKYWWNSENENYLLYVAVVLDFRYKMKYLSYCFTELFDANVAKEMCNRVEDILRQLVDEYSSCIHYYDESPTPSMDHNSNTRNCTSNDAKEDIFDGETFHFKDLFEKALEEDRSPYGDREVDLYLLEPIFDRQTTFDDEPPELDLMHCWQFHSIRFRALGEIAREILAIPVSTVASESVFDISGRVIDSTCLTLAPNLVEVFACLQNWLKKEDVSIDLRENIKRIIGLEEDFETRLKEASIMGKRTPMPGEKKE